MNLIKMFFTKTTKKRINKSFKIIHFPLTKKYYPQYNGQWLYRFISTGIIQLTDLLTIADSFSTEEDALKFIEVFKEQYFMENVKVIDVP